MKIVKVGACVCLYVTFTSRLDSLPARCKAKKIKIMNLQDQFYIFSFPLFMLISYTECMFATVQYMACHIKLFLYSKSLKTSMKLEACNYLTQLKSVLQ